jgi:hypothetical protein
LGPYLVSDASQAWHILDLAIKRLIEGIVKSTQEAVEWVERCPNPFEGESEIEIRLVFETDDFGPA